MQPPATTAEIAFRVLEVSKGHHDALPSLRTLCVHSCLSTGCKTANQKMPSTNVRKPDTHNPKPQTRARTHPNLGRSGVRFFLPPLNPKP